MMAHPLSTPLDAAEMFTARGWVVFPCDHPDAGTHCTGSARACRERRCRAERDPAQRGKCPRVPRWGAVIAPVDSVTLRGWFGRDAIPTNVAIACGPSGLLIVDEDEPGAFARFCASIGVELPDTFTVSTGRGAHYYFTVPVDPQTGERVPVGNAPGQLAAWHCDVRGGASATGEAGGYAITAGSTHASGKIYTAADPYREALIAQPWLLDAVMSPPSHPAGPPATAEGVSSRTGTGSGEAAGTLRASDGARWDDAPRYGSADDLLGQFTRHCDEVEHEGGAFRHELFLAARDGWRCVALGLLDEPSMLRALDACVWRVWAAEPDDRDHVIVFAEAQPAAAGSPWELTGSTRVLGAHVEPDRTFLRTSEAAAVVTDGSSSAPALTSAEGTPDPPMDGKPTVEGDHGESRVRESDEDRARRKALERLTAERWARETLDAQDRPPLPYITPKGRQDRPRVRYLVPRMLYRNGLACVFGAPTCGKTYFVLDIALSLAAGKPWRGQRITAADGSRGMTHYVMAEGEDTNNLRIDAFLYHHDLTNDDIEDHFRIIPAAVMLTEAGVREYLRYVEADKPDLIVLDTRNLMFVGRESQGDDYGAMLRVLHKLQVAADGCAIVLIDHAGLADGTRTRGSNAQIGGMDTEILVIDDHGLRMAEVTKDRSAPLGARWLYRLHQIDEVARDAYVAAPAVCIEAQPDSGPLRPRTPWPDMRLSDDLEKAIMDKGGRVKGAARDVVRLLGWLAGDDEGQTTAKIAGLCRVELPEQRRHGESTVRAAVGALVRAAVIESIGTARSPKYVICEHWRDHVHEP